MSVYREFVGHESRETIEKNKERKKSTEEKMRTKNVLEYFRWDLIRAKRA